MYTSNFQDSTNHTASDQTGTGTGWLNKDACTADFAFGFVRQCTLVQVDLSHVLLSNFGSFGNSRSNVCTLGNADTYLALAVTNDYKRAETEAAAALDYTCDAVNVNDTLVKLLFFWCDRSAAITVTPRATATITLRCAACASSLCVCFSHN
jgi:hypothetical protein